MFYPQVKDAQLLNPGRVNRQYAKQYRLNRSDDPHILTKEVAGSLQTAPSCDDATFPRMIRKTYGEVADGVWSKDDMALFSQGFVGPRI